MFPYLDKIAEQFPPPRIEQDRWAFIRIAALVLAVMILYFLVDLGSQPIAVGLVPPPWDKVAHFGVFAVLAFLVGFSAVVMGWSPRQILIFTFAALLLAAAFDEWVQLRYPGRHADLGDFASDVAGILAGLLILARSGLLRLRPVREKKLAGIEKN